MPKKEWNVNYNEMEIKFINKWSFSLNSIEKLFINGELVSSTGTDSNSGKRSIAGRHQIEYCFKNTSYKIEVVLGSKWPGIFLGCHIYINGELVGGDTNSKLMFT